MRPHASDTDAAMNGAAMERVAMGDAPVSRGGRFCWACWVDARSWVRAGTELSTYLTTTRCSCIRCAVRTLYGKVCWSYTRETR